MPTDATILVSEGTDKALDYESLTVSGQTVYRQRARVAGSAAAALGEVLNADPGATDYGQVVRQVGQVVPGTSESVSFPVALHGGYASHAVPSGAGSDGLRTRGWFTRSGAGVTMTMPAYGQVFVAGEGIVSQQTALYSASSAGAALIAGVASKYIYVLGIWGTAATAGVFSLTKTTGGAKLWTRQMPTQGVDSVAPLGFYLAKSAIGDGISFTNAGGASQHDLALLYFVSTASF